MKIFADVAKFGLVVLLIIVGFKLLPDPPLMVNVSTTRPVAQIATLVVVAIALMGIGNGGIAFGRQPVSLAWRASLRHMGWLPVVATLGVMLLLILPENGGVKNTPWSDRVRIVETVIPLAMAIQAALLFSPDDEPALEVFLACPRRISWVLLERLAMVLLAQTGIAFAGVALSLALVGDQDIFVALLRWLPPAIFLSGIGVYVTLRSRVATFGVVVAGLIWFAFGFFGSALLPGQPTFFPLNKIQPFLWVLNAYLQPGDLSISDYWLSRLFVTAFGIVLLMLAVYQLRNEEQVLLGARPTRKQRKEA